MEPNLATHTIHPVQHEAERQAWTHAPQAIHKHYGLQARLPPAPAQPAVQPPTPAQWLAILVRPNNPCDPPRLSMPAPAVLCTPSNFE
jgi:hypothetical protein